MFSEKGNKDHDLKTKLPGEYVTDEDRELIRNTMQQYSKQPESAPKTRVAGVDPNQKMKMVGATDDGKIFKYSKSKFMEMSLRTKHMNFEECFRENNAGYRDAIDNMPSLKTVKDEESLAEAIRGRTKAYFQLREIKLGNKFAKKKFERHCARLRTEADMAKVAIHGTCDLSRPNKKTKNTTKDHSDKLDGVVKENGHKKRWKERRTEEQNDKMEEIQEKFNKPEITELKRKRILGGAKRRYRRRNWSSEMRTWKRKKTRFRKTLKDLTEEETNERMKEWESKNPNPANVVALVGIGNWMQAANCPLKGYPKTSFGRLHKAIDQHPRTMQRVGHWGINECCTSKVCSYCGGFHENLEVRNKEGKKEKIHHVTHCKSVKDHENGITCEMYDIYSSRDIPGAKAILLCTEYEAKCLFKAKMKNGKTWKDMTKAQMIQFRKDARQSGLPHYRPGRSIKREQENTQQTKIQVGDNRRQTQ